MSTPLPTHEVVAVFPAEIKSAVVRLPVRMHGELQVLTASRVVMEAMVTSLRTALDKTPIHPLTGRPARYFKQPAAQR